MQSVCLEGEYKAEHLKFSLQLQSCTEYFLMLLIESSKIMNTYNFFIYNCLI